MTGPPWESKQRRGVDGGTHGRVRYALPLMWPWIVIAAGCLMIGVAKSGFGGGLGLMAIPAITLALGATPFGSETTLGFLLPLLFFADILAVWQFRNDFNYEILRRLFWPGMAGIAVATLSLWLIRRSGNEDIVATVLRLEIGVESILLVGLYWWRSYRGMQTKMMTEPARSLIVGSFCGISSTLAHAAGPILAAYLLPMGLPRRQFVGTTAAFFFMLNALKLPFYMVGGLFSGTPWKHVLGTAPAIVVGMLLGALILRRLSDKVFTKIIYVMTFLLGVYLIGDAVWRLM